MCVYVCVEVGGVGGKKEEGGKEVKRDTGMSQEKINEIIIADLFFL